MPSTRWEKPIVCSFRTPRSRFILVGRHHRAEDAVNDAPAFVDAVLSRKECAVAAKGVAEQSLVGCHLIGLLIDREKFDLLANHPLAIDFDLRIEADLDTRIDLQSKEVMARRQRFVKDNRWRTVELDAHLGCREWHVLARAQINRHPRPTPVFNVEANCGVGLGG